MIRALIGGLLLAATILPTALPAATPPNVVLIYTDDQGSVDLNCYGATDLETPNLDRLAQSGTRFTNMSAPSAICSASRAGLLTGRIPPRAGVPGNVSSSKGNPGMPESEVTLAELLKAAGYRTGHVGKWHLGYTPETMPNGQGFGHSFGHMGGCIDNYSHFFYWAGPNRHDLWKNGEEIWRDGEYFGDLMLAEAKEFVARESSDPFFLYWAINWPHYPMQGTANWREFYKDLPHPRDKYAMFVSSVDDLVGAIVGHLEKLGLRDNTLIIYQSDHGHSVEDRAFGGGGSAGEFRGHKGNLFEGGLRVPAIVSLPGVVPAGEVRDQWVTGCDWFPTIAEITGAKLPDGVRLDGKSILGLIQDADQASPHDEFYWRLGKSRVLRQGHWKLHLGAKENVRPKGAPELNAEDRKVYLVDLKADPGERENLAGEQADRVKAMQARADAWEKGMGSP